MSKILVIDDNELVGKMLKEALTEQGFEVQVALDANQGYAAAIEFHPALMLIDVQLPDVVGFDLIRIIKNREELRLIPIIMITGTAHKTEEKVRGFQLGADDYVIKPFEMPELVERIRAVLRRSVKAVTPSPSMGEGWDGGGGRQHNPPPSPSPTRGEGKNSTQAELSLRQAVSTLLIAPFEFKSQAHYPHLVMAYVITALALSFAGLAVTAGAAPKAVLVGFAVVGSWGVLVSVLVMVASLMGISLSWKEGARLASLAGLPMLFKMTGAFLTAAWTSLSPFYFTASPALFMKSAPAWLERFDLFEIWTAFLIWILLRGRPGSSPKKAWVVTGVVWLTGLAVAAGLGKLG